MGRVVTNLETLKLLKVRYQSHKGNAKGYGTAFLLTFDEWVHIWLDSGHWEERGPYKGQYVMARFGDVGPYAIGNVKIILAEANASERHLGVPKSEDHKKKFRVPKSEEHKQNMRGKRRPLSEERKAEVSRSLIGNQNNKGKVWITDGVRSLLIHKVQGLPIGWSFGRALKGGRV